MDTRRITAVVSLGLVAAVVVALIATSGGDAGSEVAAPTAPQQADPAASPDDDPAAEPAPTAAPSDAPTTQAPTTQAPTTQAPTTQAPMQSDAQAVTSVDEPPQDVATTTLDPDTPDLPDRGPHPEFLPVQEWIQTDATEFEDFDGKVLAVQFWTFGCHNCQATYPHMRALHDTYAGADFEVIGVHAPEFDYEDDVDAVRQAAQDNGLVWPIAIEFEETKANFRSWQERRFWPRLFLIDADGNVRYDHIGEGAYDEIDAAVAALIAEKNA